MDAEQFDRIAKILGTGVRRRQVVRALGIGIPSLASTQIIGRPAPLEVAAQGQQTECALDEYPTAGTSFEGEIRADEEFFDALDSIDQCARDNDVSVVITSSYREPGKPVGNVIVPPAKRSNHHAGHAIDMNVRYFDGETTKLCNSKCLGKDTRPEPVDQFITCVKNAGLRWGGDFKKSDPVHFDDGLNLDEAAWKARIAAISCPKGEKCNSNGVCCPPKRSCCGLTLCAKDEVCCEETGACGPKSTPCCDQPGQPLCCNNLVESGGDAPETHTVDLGKKRGSFQFSYQAYTVRDRFIVSYEGQVLFDSSCVSGGATVPLRYSGSSTIITVSVEPNCDGDTGTVWDFEVVCEGRAATVQDEQYRQAQRRREER